MGHTISARPNRPGSIDMLTSWCLPTPPHFTTTNMGPLALGTMQTSDGVVDDQVLIDGHIPSTSMASSP